MASPRIEYAVLPAGEGPGQDRCFTDDSLVVVLDGASAYDPSVSPDASEYVDTLGPLLMGAITGTPGIDLRDALAEAIRQTADKLALIPGKGPSSTVSIVRWSDETVDVLVLGDSPVVVQFTDGSEETIVQHPMDHIAPDLRRLYRERLSAGHGYDEEHRRTLAEIQRQEAKVRNQHEGHYVAEADPVAASHAETETRLTQSVRFIVAATDGAVHPIDHLGRSYDELRHLVGAALGALLEELQTWESIEDPNGRALPRSKRHDDKTVVTMQHCRAANECRQC